MPANEGRQDNAELERHSHIVVIGRVISIEVAESGPGLVYWRGRYDEL